MKIKTMKRLSVIMAAALVATSCAESGVDESNKYDNPNEVKVDVYASSPSADTTTPVAVNGSKVAFDTPAGEKWTAVWEQYDHLAGWSQEDDTFSRFSQATFDAEKSTFRGDVNGNTYRLIYPYAEVKSISDGIYSLDISSQAGDLSTNPMINNAIVDKTASSTGDVYMQHIAAAASLNIDMLGVLDGMKLASVTVEGAPVTADIDLTKTVDEADFCTNAANGVITISPESPVAVKNGVTSFKINLLPFEFAAGGKLKVVVTLLDADGAALEPIETSVENKSTNPVAIERAMNYELVCSCNASSTTVVEPTTTIGELVAKLTAPKKTVENLNEKEAVVFEAIITSSTAGNNVLNGYAMAQDQGATAPGHGTLLAGLTADNMKALAKSVGVTSGESFGIKVRVNIPTEKECGFPLAITNFQSNYAGGTVALKLVDGTINASMAKYVTALEVVEDIKPIDISAKTSNIKAFQGMYVTVPKAVLSTSGTSWCFTDKGSHMKTTAMKTSGGADFNIFVKGQSTGFNVPYYPNNGSVVGTVIVHTEWGIGPRTIKDVADFLKDNGTVTPPPAPSGETTISEMLKLVTPGTAKTVTLNEDGEVSFHAVITSSSVGNNVHFKMLMMQEADENGVVSTEPNSGLVMAAVTQTAVKALVKDLSSDSFGVLVKVTIPAKSAGTAATIESIDADNTCMLKYDATDNTSIITPIKVVEMDQYAIDVTEKAASIKNYVSMFVKVPSAKILSTETNGGVLTTAKGVTKPQFVFIPAKTSTGGAFNIAVKGQLYSTFFYKYIIATGPVTGTVLAKSSYGIAPRTIADIQTFIGDKVE